MRRRKYPQDVRCFVPTVIRRTAKTTLDLTKSNEISTRNVGTMYQQKLQEIGVSTLIPAAKPCSSSVWSCSRPDAGLPDAQAIHSYGICTLSRNRAQATTLPRERGMRIDGVERCICSKPIPVISICCFLPPVFVTFLYVTLRQGSQF